MIAEQSTPTVRRMLIAAEWVRKRTVGSHSFWVCSSGAPSVTVADGHRKISPGVMRNINKALEACHCFRGEQ
jgi:predicted RNA binding protein YcfA (HicA-like mRNA interferase family)